MCDWTRLDDFFSGINMCKKLGHNKMKGVRYVRNLNLKKVTLLY